MSGLNGEHSRLSMTTTSKPIRWKLILDHTPTPISLQDIRKAPQVKDNKQKTIRKRPINKKP